MKHTLTLLTALLLAPPAVLLVSSGHAADAAPRPNILFIMAEPFIQV